MSASRNISLRHIRCFLEVANSGSFTVAASRLFVTQSALTTTIQQFEETVGLKLFDRTTRRVVLTQEGETFRPEAERLIKQFENTIDDLSAFALSQKGHIRIAAAASIIYQYLVDAIEVFRASYPDITLMLRDAGAEQVERMVSDGEIDFAVTSRHKSNDGLDYTPLLTDRYGVICSPAHELARHEGPLRWDSLPAQGFVGFTPDTGIGSFLQNHAGHFAMFQGLHDEISSTTSLYAMLANRNRYSIVPALAVHSGGSGDFVFRELIEPSLEREICLITRRLRSMSPSAKRLVRVLLETMTERPLPDGVRAHALPATPAKGARSTLNWT